MSEPLTESATYEQALQRLEALVASMESGDVPLAELVAAYEEGCRLHEFCERRLREAELKVEVLRQRASRGGESTASGDAPAS